MQDAERIERALLSYLGETETSPTEGGDPEARAASMAKRVSDIITLKVCGAKVLVSNGMAVVRVSLRSRQCGKRTVTAGMDSFSQLAGPALDEMPRSLVPGALAAVRAALGGFPDALQLEVTRASERLTSDPEQVSRWKGVLSEVRDKKVRAERENLVSKMLSLLTEGWTVDQLREAVDDACCRHVMSA